MKPRAPVLVLVDADTRAGRDVDGLVDDRVPHPRRPRRRVRRFISTESDTIAPLSTRTAGDQNYDRLTVPPVTTTPGDRSVSSVRDG